jgi:23S rRNA pseudouridine1911/1915/1917 synthase
LPFVLKKYQACKGKKIQIFLMQDMHYKPAVANRLISRGRVFKENKSSYKMSEIINEEYIYIALFEGHSRGLKPLLIFSDFAIFDKPSHLMIHPISKSTDYSLLDEIRFHLGEDANQAHRIDAETSGLVLVGLNSEVTNALATMFEKKEYKKSYIAIVEGKIEKELTIDKNLKKEGKAIGVRMTTCSKEEGKESKTIVKPIKYNEKRNLSLVELIPVTGRQHQLRVHLYSIGHKILGDPIYGIDDETAENYLTKELSSSDRIEKTGSSRLWLHANYLEFAYKGIYYKLFSKNRAIFDEFEL